MFRFRHLLTTGATTLVAGGITLVTSLAAARLLTPEQNGYYSQYLLVLSLTYTLMNFGIGPATTHFISSGKASAAQFLRISNLLLAGSGMILATLTVLLLMSGDAILRQFKMPAAILFNGLAAGWLLIAFYQGTSILLGQCHFDRANAMSMNRAILPLLAILALGWFSRDGAAFATISTIAMMLSALVCMRVAYTSTHGTIADGLVASRPVMKYAGMAYASNLLHFMALRGLMFILAFYYSPKEVGFFSLAMAILEALLVVPSTIGLLVFPQSSRATLDQAWIGLIIRLNIYLGAIIATGVWLLSDRVIQALLGEAYLQVATGIDYLAPAILLLAIPRILSQVLSGKGHPEYPLYAAILSALLGAISAFWLVPEHGIIGLAWSIDLISAITAIVMVYGYMHEEGARPAEIFSPRLSDMQTLRRGFRRIINSGSSQQN